MFVKVHAIVMRVIRYSDTQQIITLYTRELGRVSCMSPAGATREALRRKALLMPLALIEAEVDTRPGRELATLRDVRAPRPLHSLTMDPAKAAIALFVADIANASLREPEPDEAMYALLADTALSLDGARGSVANHHLCFMTRLQRFMGIEPDWSTWHEGWTLDMIDGVCRPSIPTHGYYLRGDETAYARRLARINPRNAHLYRLSGDQRNIIIDRMLKYFDLHDVRLGAVKSLDILRSIF